VAKRPGTTNAVTATLRKFVFLFVRASRAAVLSKKAAGTVAVAVLTAVVGDAGLRDAVVSDVFSKRFDLLRLGDRVWSPYPFRMYFHVPARETGVRDVVSWARWPEFVADGTLRLYSKEAGKSH